MARSLPKSSSSEKVEPKTQTAAQGAIWGVDSNTAGGGVWAQTSAKKDKLNELLTDLNGEGVDTGKLGEFCVADDVFLLMLLFDSCVCLMSILCEVYCCS